MFAALLSTVGLLQAVQFTTGAEDAAIAADLTKFEPGRIIDDSIFFNGSAMTARQVHDFLVSKRPTCDPGYTCLKDLRQATPSKPADAMCKAYTGGAYESAADIIAKVGEACGISQKVLVVMLQKEQGLVLSSSPSQGRFTIAMGMACPDTAPCDPNFFGFFHQVYEGAKQLKRYGNPPGSGSNFTRYAPGGYRDVLYHPNSACGSSKVYIHNQATANLYYYTPYQPNAASLRAGYAIGDSCSSYGNRNFYNYFTDWFGSTRGAEVGSPFVDYYAANKSWLGYPSSAMVCTGPNAGCSQAFVGGSVFSSASTAPQGVRPGYLGAWANYGREFDKLGYPISDEICGMGGAACRQEFQGGWLVRSDRIGYRVVLTPEREMWGWWGRETGFIGLPITDKWCSGAVCFQEFDGAWLVSSSAGGLQVVPAAVRATWGGWGREYGILGVPTSSPSVPGGASYTQSFQGGVVTVTNGAAAVTSATDPWWNAIVTAPWLGAAQSGQSCTLKGGACYQPFAGGWVVRSPAGAYAVPSSVVQMWGWWGREWGMLGFPTSAPSANPTTGNYTQSFQGGGITVTNGSAAVTSSTDPWWNAVLSSPWLGAASSGQSCALKGGACFQQFANGWVLKSPAGSFAVPAAVVQTWGWYGREYGILGFPTGAPSADPTTGNYTQSFQGGVITVTGGAAAVTSATDPWWNTVLTTSWLGAAQSGQSCTLKGGACYQLFANGWVVKSPAGVYAVPSGAVQVWGWYGREYGALGFPTSAPSAAPSTGNYTQSFQGGEIRATNGAFGVTLAG